MRSNDIEFSGERKRVRCNEGLDGPLDYPAGAIPGVELAPKENDIHASSTLAKTAAQAKAPLHPNDEGIPAMIRPDVYPWCLAKGRRVCLERPSVKPWGGPPSGFALDKRK